MKNTRKNRKIKIFLLLFKFLKVAQTLKFKGIFNIKALCRFWESFINQKFKNIKNINIKPVFHKIPLQAQNVVLCQYEFFSYLTIKKQRSC